MAATPQTRRERLRAEATDEIKAIAMRLLSESGPAAISLRAIAREMGMTAGAIYGYFPTRDDLVSALVADVYGSVAEAQERAVAGERDRSSADRLRALAEVYRAWAIASPNEFRLIYGDGVPGYVAPPGGAATEAEHRACAVLIGLALGAGPDPIDSDRFAWSDFDPGFVEVVREGTPSISPAGLALALRIWGRMHGLVALEVYGHLGPQVTDPSKLYRAEIDALAELLG